MEQQNYMISFNQLGELVLNDEKPGFERQRCFDCDRRGTFVRPVYLMDHLVTYNFRCLECLLKKTNSDKYAFVGTREEALHQLYEDFIIPSFGDIIKPAKTT